MAEEKKTYVTEEGLKALEAEYDNLVHVVREEVKAELKEARSLGDLSENADYDAAREKQSQVESRIADLESMIKNHVIIRNDPNSPNVNIGSTVSLQFEDTKEEATYHIVGSTEADPLNGRISNESPLAKAIEGKKAGQVVEVNVKKPYKVMIVSVNNDTGSNSL